MVTCENGHQNPDDCRFCGECGAPIVPAVVLCPAGH
ncbi:zinc-ribbon domain-containing protein [Mycobacterium kansasii]